MKLGLGFHYFINNNIVSYKFEKQINNQTNFNENYLNNFNHISNYVAGDTESSNIQFTHNFSSHLFFGININETINHPTLYKNSNTVVTKKSKFNSLTGFIFIKPLFFNNSTYINLGYEYFYIGENIGKINLFKLGFTYLY